MQSDIRTKQIVFWILSTLKSFKVSVCILFWVAIFWAVDFSVRPYLVKIILNRVEASLPQTIFSNLAWPVGLYMLMFFLMATSFRLYNYFLEIQMFPKLRAVIANKAVDCLLDQSHHYYQHHFSGSLANKVNDLTNSIPSLIRITMDRFFSHGLALLIGIITLWQVNYYFALFILTWTLACLIGALCLSKHFTGLARAWSELGSTITGKVVDVLSNMLSLRLFAAKNQEKQSLNQTFEQTVLAEQKLHRAYLWLWICVGHSFLIFQGFNFYFLCKGRQEGWISVGDFALVLMINIAIIEGLWEVLHDFSEFSTLWGRISQALKTLLHKPDIQDAPHAEILKVNQGSICFENVKFHYKGTEALFNNKSVRIEPGQKVGLVGYSGSGKSTFVHLILRLYDISEGRILIDDQEIRSVTQDSLHLNIAMIPQDPSLFHRTLMENIRYGYVEATDEAVIRAAQKAHAHEFISQLPEGYASLVGERGVKLSGGQRQRIAIARAILKNAPILILDEATSQLDSVTEGYIQESLWTLMQDKTTLVIAHRLSTLLHMDRILVFDQGKIVEDGTHAELLAAEGLYKTLWNAQVGGFLPNRKEPH